MDKRGKRDGFNLSKKIDIKVIERAIKKGSNMPYERDYEDLRRWWWHLDKIAERTYPSELLPEHLREIYLKGS